MIGKILGDRYELLEKVGEGGMAVVYKARCLKLNRYNAIKILKREFSSNAEIVDKFKREATAMANFSHPNIISVQDVGSQDGLNYIVMEYVKGKTLKQVIREQGKINSKTAVEISIQIAKALECAHKNNIVHRDIKPQNILITEEGIVKVSDFGIAKSVSASTMTHTTTVMGSAHYFSPEQAKGSYLDERTDLYSLGVVMYEMVTGKLPFDSDNAVSIALKHIQEAVVPPKEYAPDIPDSLNAAILKAMEKEPIRRYQSAKDMLNDLIKIKNNVSFVVVTNDLSEDETRIMSPVTVEDDDEDSFDDDKPQKNKKKRLLLMILAAVVVLALGAIVAAVTLGGGVGSSKNVKVPEIMGMDKEQAEKLLNSYGLEMEVVAEINSEEEEGKIIDVSPKEGTEVKKNSTVKVKISKGVALKEVPKVTGLNIEVAKQMLSLAGFETTITSKYDDMVEKDNVISQSPEPNEEAEAGSTIALVVSNGKETVNADVPNLAGRTSSEAQTLLEAVNLMLGKVKEVETSNKDEDGKVIFQSIPSGTSVKEGTSVDVSIGKYKAKSVDFSTKGFEGSTYGDIKAELNRIKTEFNLKIKYKGITGSEPEDNDTVESISPSVVEEGGVVTIEFSKADETP